MALDVASSVAKSLEGCGNEISVAWHAGEPLAMAQHDFAQLLSAFSGLVQNGRVKHVLQTNATLLNPIWIDILMQHRVAIGVSLDGPALLNHNRVDWSGRSAFERALRGVELLRSRDISFTAIAVIGNASLTSADAIYSFFVELGCSSLGINFEEKVGAYEGYVTDSAGVRRFWTDLFRAWRQNPVIEVREFNQILSWMIHASSQPPAKAVRIEIFPCVAWNGDVVLLSPEFIGCHSVRYQNFVVGNVLQRPLHEILANAQTISYVNDYVRGVKRCEASCPYFSACGGLSAANKFFETGTTDATETFYCINSTQEAINVILEQLN